MFEWAWVELKHDINFSQRVVYVLQNSFNSYQVGLDLFFVYVNYIISDFWHSFYFHHIYLRDLIYHSVLQLQKYVANAIIYKTSLVYIVEW